VSKKERCALIDGDSFLYRAAFAVEKTRYLLERRDANGNPTFTKFDKKGQIGDLQEGDTLWMRKEIGTLEDAIGVLNSMIRKAYDNVRWSIKFVYLSPSVGNFRDVVATLKRYKGNRDGLSRPVYYGDLREYLTTAYGAIITRNEEADDQISWFARGCDEKGIEPIIVGIDKDLDQIPGEHYNWVEEKTYFVTEDEAKLNFWQQVLSGDPGDNIGGCWELGEKRAKRFLSQCHSLSDEAMWPKIVKKYEESKKIEGCPYKDKNAEEVALETARLVRLRQKSDEKLWTPKLEEQGDRTIGKKAEGSAQSAEGKDTQTG